MAPESPLPGDNRGELTRRDLVGLVTGVAAAVALGAFASLSMVLRFLRPPVKPFHLFAPPDQVDMPAQVVAKLSDLVSDYQAKDFIFRQVNVEYTPTGVQTVEIPGFAVKLPEGVGAAETKGIEVWSRICPHLGCIFNIELDPETVQRNYGGFRPGGPVFACPCHLSIYDLSQDGKVISGPAPRPPRKFKFEIRGEDVVVTAPPEGGLA